MKESISNWVKANPEKYSSKTNPTIKASKDSWRKANPEKWRTYNKKWYSENAEYSRQKSTEYKLANPERVKKTRKSWADENKDILRANRNKRRARLQSCGGVLSKEIVGRLLVFQHGKCPCCKLPLGDDFHLDHIVPLALGGSNTDDNAQLMRKGCNLRKGAKHPIDYMQQKGFLL